MTETISFGRKLNIGIAAILLFILGIGFLLGALLLASWSAWLLWGVMAVIGILALPLAWLAKKLSGSNAKPHAFARNWIVSVLLITSLLTFPYFYFAVKSETNPLVLPQAVLSDGNKTVIFQGMVHVGSESFYKSVVYDLEAALNDGYKIYYEGIMPSTEEANKWFAETLAGGASLSDNYRTIADVCGVKFQLDYFQLLVKDILAHPEHHATVDVSTADIKAEYERLLKEDPAFAAAVASDSDNKSEDQLSDESAKKIYAFVQQANDSQKNIIGTVCRGFFAYALKPGNNRAASTLDPVLVDYRNVHLAQQIQADTSEKIYITYGAGHLPGLIKLLQQSNAQWEVKSLKWLRGMAAPEHFEGQL